MPGWTPFPVYLWSRVLSSLMKRPGCDDCVAGGAVCRLGQAGQVSQDLKAIRRSLRQAIGNHRTSSGNDRLNPYGWLPALCCSVGAFLGTTGLQRAMPAKAEVRHSCLYEGCMTKPQEYEKQRTIRCETRYQVQEGYRNREWVYSRSAGTSRPCASRHLHDGVC